MEPEAALFCFSYKTFSFFPRLVNKDLMWSGSHSSPGSSAAVVKFRSSILQLQRSVQHRCCSGASPKVAQHGGSFFVKVRSDSCVFLCAKGNCELNYLKAEFEVKSQNNAWQKSYRFPSQNSTQACKCLQTLTKNGNYKQWSPRVVPYVKQTLFVLLPFVFSADPGAADGAWLRVAHQGAAEKLFSCV